MLRRKVLVLQATRVDLFSKIFIATTAVSSLLAASVFLYITWRSSETEIRGLERSRDVTITDGTYATSFGDVPYRLCISNKIRSGFVYPGIFFAPGLTVQLDRWTPYCVELAEKGYMTFMKGRVGENYGQWEEEVAKGLVFFRRMEEVDDDRIAAIAESFGNQEIQSYGVEHPADFKGYVNVSGYNNPQVMAGSLEGFDLPTILLSGGGEEPAGERDCDHDAFLWTGEFATKLQNENSAYFEGRWVFSTEDGYGCVHHGYMWDPKLKATQDSARIILDFLDQVLGREPKPA